MCYKYSKTPSDKKCRFGLDPSNLVEKTTIDAETGQLSYRISNGMINLYIDFFLRLVRCNHDVKFFGSRAIGKSIMYYVTDYITKKSLKAHVSYASLLSAVQRIQGAIPNLSGDVSAQAMKLLSVCANAVVSNQELSAPQVASYLMNYGDHYTSHVFANLYWPAFESYIDRYWNIAQGIFSEDSVENSEIPDTALQYDDTLLEHIEGEQNVRPKPSAALDYELHGSYYRHFSVWDMIRQTQTFLLKTAAKNLPDHFRFQPNHPDFHLKYTKPLSNFRVPVLIGPSIPHRDHPEIYEQYCKIMLMLFKPWRLPSDLKSHSQMWSDAFACFRSSCRPDLLQILMENMQFLHECKDCHDDHFQSNVVNNFAAFRGLDTSNNDEITREPETALEDDEVEVISSSLQSTVETDADMVLFLKAFGQRDSVRVVSIIATSLELGLFAADSGFDNGVFNHSVLIPQELTSLSQESIWMRLYKSYWKATL